MPDVADRRPATAAAETTFGAVTVGPAGLAAGSTALRWDEVDHYTIHNNHLLVFPAGPQFRRADIIRASFAGVLNPPALLAALEQYGATYRSPEKCDVNRAW